MLDIVESIALRPPDEQAAIIDGLAARNTGILDQIADLFPEMTGNSIFRLVADDRKKVARVVLVTLVYDEIGFWQLNECRKIEVGNLRRVCDRLAIEFADVILMHQRIHQLSQRAQKVEVRLALAGNVP